MTMVTSAGLVHNAGWQSINNEVDIDDLFMNSQTPGTVLFV